MVIVISFVSNIYTSFLGTASCEVCVVIQYNNSDFSLHALNHHRSSTDACYVLSLIVYFHYRQRSVISVTRRCRLRHEMYYNHAFTLGRCGGVFQLSLPNVNESGWNLEYKWVVVMRTHTKNLGEIAPGVAPTDATTYVVFCLSPIQCGLSATYPAPISTAFEIKDVNRCAHA